MGDRISVSCGMTIPVAGHYYIKPSVTLTHELQEGEDHDTVFNGLSYQCAILFYRQAMQEADIAQAVMTLQGEVVLASALGDFKQKVADFLASFATPAGPG